MDGDPQAILTQAGASTRRESIRRRLRPLAGPVLGALGGAALVFLAIRPDQGALPDPGRSVAEEWYDGMARLGIRAVYPPTEDMHVGDLWAVVVPPEGAEPSGGALLTRAVRIGHIGVRDRIVEASNRRPLFAESGPDEAARRESDRLRLEAGGAEAERIALALVMFPASQVRRTMEIEAAGGGVLGLFGGARKVSLVEEISVPHALGYGIAAGAATEALLLWCHENRVRCSRAYLENLVRCGLGADVLAPAAAGGPAASVELRMINYVFLARQIETRRVIEGMVGSSGRLGAPPPGEAGAARGNGEGATLRVTQSDSQGVSVQQSFARPVAIGFRAVAMKPFDRAGGS